MQQIQPSFDEKRRKALKTLLSASLLPLAGSVLARPTNAEAVQAKETPVNVIVPREYAPPIDDDSARRYTNRLGTAVLDFVRDNYKGRHLPVWKQKYGTMDLEKRVMNICYWIVRGVRDAKDIYPLDPAWVAGQMMAESFFYEFAVSWAFAVGPCQFISSTANTYDMLCAADAARHAKAPYKRPDLAGELVRYYALRKKWKQARRIRRNIGGDSQALLRKALLAARDGKTLPLAEKYLRADALVTDLAKQVKEARQNFRTYITENLKGRSIFNKNDLDFLMGFDQRVVYHKPIPAMVLMLARNLKARSGNIIAATAGYNAGLGHTHSSCRIYGKYGTIPTFSETVTYVSRVFINHHEIVSRMV